MAVGSAEAVSRILALASLYCSVTENGRALAVTSKNVCDELTGSLTGFSEACGLRPEVNCGSAKVTTSQIEIALSKASERRLVIKAVVMPASAKSMRYNHARA